MERIGVVLFGVTQNLQFDLVEQAVVEIDPLQIVERMPQNESDALPDAQIGEPVPGEDAFDGDGDPLPERSDRFQKRIGIRLHVAVKNDRALLIENAQVHRSRVQINSAVMRMLLRIEFHRPPLS